MLISPPVFTPSDENYMLYKSLSHEVLSSTAINSPLANSLAVIPRPTLIGFVGWLNIRFYESNGLVAQLHNLLSSVRTMLLSSYSVSWTFDVIGGT